MLSLILAVWSVLFPSVDKQEVAVKAAIVLPLKMPYAHQSGIASMFGSPGDKHIGGNLGCDSSRKIHPDDQFCAHRSYPCGSTLVIENIRTKKRTYCTVMDRGPYGAYVYDENNVRSWVIKIRDHHPGEWRGVVDLSPKVSKDIGHNGWERVRIWEYNRLKKGYLGFLDKLNRI